MARTDPHSFHDDRQPCVRDLSWRARVDFETKVLECEATLALDRPGDGPLDLDTRGLTIHSVTSDAGAALPFRLGAVDPILGQCLTITLTPPTRRLTIRYRTSPDASALQWLSPAQTKGGRYPFLYSQCQAIHARSVVPLQDTPKVRITHDCELRVPPHLKTLMAAAFLSREVADEDDAEWAVERWRMPQPIPPYLLAFAVGDLASHDVGPRSRVWSEPSTLEAAAWEFAHVEDMIEAAEKLFGPYAWDRFDVLALPPSFPYGGMENPRLTFITPTVIAGDRSLVNVLAHELAHSWTGNLVTNSNAEHFWLNEGWTVYAERRILEALEGPERAALHAALGRRSLEKAVARFKDRPQLTKLRTQLAGVDPDDAFSTVPYEKGYLLLRALEEAVGRPTFDVFVQRYIETFRFRSITTEEFVAFTEKQLPGALGKVNAGVYLQEPGIPASAPVPRSTRLDALGKLPGGVPDDKTAAAWSSTEWQLWLESLPHPSPPGALDELEARFKLTSRTNAEVLVAWLALCAASGWAPARDRIREVLGTYGRMKFLKEIYGALVTYDEGKRFARACFNHFSPGYHPIARQVVEALLEEAGA